MPVDYIYLGTQINLASVSEILSANLRFNQKFDKKLNYYFKSTALNDYQYNIQADHTAIKNIRVKASWCMFSYFITLAF